MVESEMANVGDPLDVIRGISENDYVLGLLEQQVRQGSGVVPFVGTGVSIPFGMLGWRDFLRDQARLAGTDSEVDALLGAEQYEEAAELLLGARQPRRFQDAIGDAYGDHRLSGAVFAHTAADAICRLAVGPVITTNFDHVLERAALAAACPLEPVWGAKVDLAVDALHGGSRLLLKLHGDVRDSTERVLTRRDYELAYGSSADPAKITLDKNLPRVLDLLFAARPVLFIGCSLAADRTLRVLQQVTERHREIAHYALVPRPVLPSEVAVRDKHLSSLSIRPIWYPAGQHDLLVPLLEYLADLVPPSRRPCNSFAPATGPKLIASVEATGPRPYLNISSEGSNVYSIFVRLNVRFTNERSQPISINHATLLLKVSLGSSSPGYVPVDSRPWYYDTADSTQRNFPIIVPAWENPKDRQVTLEFQGNIFLDPLRVGMDVMVALTLEVTGLAGTSSVAELCPVRVQWPSVG